MRQLRQGDEGADVESLQLLVGWRTGQYVEVTGIFDERTKMTVMMFQRIRHIDYEPGVIDVETWQALLEGTNQDALSN